MTAPGGTGRSPLAAPALAPLVDELHRRFGEGRAPSTIRLQLLEDETRRALADLLGADRLPPSSQVRLPVDRLLRALALANVDALRRAVEAQAGPILDRRATRQAASDARTDLWAWFADVAAELPWPDAAGGSFVAWLEDLRAAGIPGGLDRHRRRLTAVLTTLRALPADDIGLAVFAADVVGDPHALDRGRSVARLVLDAVARQLGADPPADAEAARQLWEAVGVVPDPHSSSVMVLGLRPAGDDPLSAWLRACAEHDEPAVLSLAQLRRWPIAPLPPSSTAYVVENPSILAHAVARPVPPRGLPSTTSCAAGGRPPIICSSGRPTVAVVALIRQLAAAGAEIRQHADFDRGGVGITTWLQAKVGTTPWRMDADHYRAAIAVDRSADRVPLGGPLAPTPWDPELRHAMLSAGVALYEEDVRDELLAAMT